MWLFADRSRARVASRGPRAAALWLALALALSACGGASGSSAAGAGAGATGGAGQGGAGAASQGGQGGEGAQGGQGGGAAALALDDVLAALRADLEGARLAYSRSHGFPLPVELDDGTSAFLVVSTLGLPSVAGDFDGWAGTPLTGDQGFSWAALEMAPGDGYKLTDQVEFVPDDWSRAYRYDDFGELSLVHPAPASPPHLERFFAIEGAGLGPRTVRVWVPSEPPTHVLYAHDGQNLFDPGAFFGGWKLDESVPPAMLVVAIDNTPARMDEYTHVPDVIGGDTMGGQGDAYASLLEGTVRPLVADVYGEPQKAGLLGSSLGGLISLHVADRNPEGYVFAASLSGTLGWGSIGDGVHNETLIERFASTPKVPVVLYLDSGGGGATCEDADGDGLHDDDLEADDNYCETLQMLDAVVGAGWTLEGDVFHWHEPGAPHNEAAWAARVFRPLELFASL